MSTEREIAEKFRVAAETKDIESAFPFFAEGMTYEILPSSVGGKMTPAEFKGHMNGMFGKVDYVKLEFTKVIERPLFVVAQANVNLGFKPSPFTQEIMLLFDFSKDESGALKIVSITEFVDSFKVQEFKAKFAGKQQPSE